MNKKIIVGAFVLLTFLATGAVFAQVCLSNNAARVSGSGSSVSVMNKMNDVSINVEIDCFQTTRKSNKDTVWIYDLKPLATKSVPMPAGYEYAGTYTVYSCSSN
jgi:hypothetical protein